MELLSPHCLTNSKADEDIERRSVDIGRDKVEQQIGKEGYICGSQQRVYHRVAREQVGKRGLLEGHGFSFKKERKKKRKKRQVGRALKGATLLTR